MTRATAGLAMAVLFIGAFAASAGDPPATIADGDAALQRLDLEGAIAAYRSALEAAPDSYEALWRLARALTDKATLSKQRGEQKTLCVEAEKLARKAGGLKPKDSKGHAYLAVAVGKLALFGGRRKVGSEGGQGRGRKASSSIRTRTSLSTFYDGTARWSSWAGS
jgi:hypothetical protein